MTWADLHITRLAAQGALAVALRKQLPNRSEDQILDLVQEIAAYAQRSTHEQAQKYALHVINHERRAAR